MGLRCLGNQQRPRAAIHEIDFAKIDSGIQRAAIVTMRREFVLN